MMRVDWQISQSGASEMGKAYADKSDGLRLITWNHTMTGES